MIATSCQHNQTKKFGRDRNGNQRFRCVLCGKTWIEDRVRPIGDMRIDFDKAVQVLEMLLEGVSIRSTVRVTGIAKGTILRLLELVGTRAQYYWLMRMRDLPAENVQADEVWGYVYAKEKTCLRKHLGPDCGDAYCFVGLERDTKMVLAWHVGKREPEDTLWFSEKLRRGTAGRFQLSTDGFKPYCTAIPEAFQGHIDFAQLIKIYGKVKGFDNRNPLQSAGNKTDPQAGMWASPIWIKSVRPTSNAATCRSGWASAA